MEQVPRDESLIDPDTQEDPVVLLASKRPSYIPHFSDDHCSLAVVWDPHTELATRALTGGPPPDPRGAPYDEGSSLEEAECLVADSEVCFAGPTDPDVVEDPVVLRVEGDRRKMQMPLSIDEFCVDRDAAHEEFDHRLRALIEEEEEVVTDTGLRYASAADDASTRLVVNEEVTASTDAETALAPPARITQAADDAAPASDEASAHKKLERLSCPKEVDQANVGNSSVVMPSQTQMAPPSASVSPDEEIIVSQQRVSTKYSAGVALKLEDVVAATPQNAAPLTAGNAADSPKIAVAATTQAAPQKEAGTPKPKSKGFFSFFRRTPKPKSDVTSADYREKSKSLPRNVSGAKTGSDSTSEIKPEAKRRSGFFTFGSRSRRKSDKAAAAEKATTSTGGHTNTPNTPNTTNTTSTTPNTLQTDMKGNATVSTTAKSNIRVLEIMAQSETPAAGAISDPEHQDNDFIRIDSTRDGHPSEEVAHAGYSVHLEPPAGTFGVSGGVKQAGQGQGTSSASPVVNQSSYAAEGGDRRAPEATPSSKYLIVVAIDFGTAFSGYAFSFMRDPGSIHMMARWEGGDPGVINQKAPTILLLTPEGEFHSFGFTARNHYHDLSPEEALQWLYFDKFKMTLYKKAECSRQTALVAANGVKYPALRAVALTLAFFRHHALTELSAQCGTEILNEDVRWIVTVPAIWNAAAKQFMRLAAYEAELASPDAPDQLVVALEPEAASVHIRRLRLHELVPERPVNKPLSVKKDIEPVSLETVASQFKPVARYMVVDCGGGTVDITVHDVSAVTGQLQEVYKATGGPYGSVGIDADFETLLCAIFGEDFIASFRRNRPSGWVGLMLAFESRKRAASPFRAMQPLNVALPFAFIDYHNKVKGESVEKAIVDFGEPEVRWSSQGMLRLSPEAMTILFQTTVDNIKETVAEIFRHVTGIQDIFLVGGLSESPMLQQAIRQEFSSRARVIVPQEANLAVLKGAVCFGLDPAVVAARRSKLTYGAAVLHRFLPGAHPEAKRLRRDGADWCRDVLDRFVTVNQIMRRGDTIVRWYTPATSAQKHISVNIYSTEHEDVQFVTDPRVSKCATISLDLTRGGAVVPGPRRRIQTFMTFADTEIKVTAVDGATGEKVSASIDFLFV